MPIIPELDRLMASAWPPAIAETNGPWLNRFTSGITRRANSVLAIGEPPDLAAAVSAAERFYDRHRLPTVFQVSEASAPIELGPYLLDRGYVSSARTSLIWASVDDVLATGLVDAPTEQRATFSCSATPSSWWFETYRSVEQARISSDADVGIVRDQLLAPAFPALFVSGHLETQSPSDLARLSSAGAAVNNDAGNSESRGSEPRSSEVASRVLAPDAVVQVVTQDDWACVQCLATHTQSRRRGLAAGLLFEAAARAKEQGVSRLYAAVMSDNEASLSLFRRASFRASHDYSYFSRPLAG